MAIVNTDIPALKERLSQLRDQKKANTLELNGVEAMVEASFRVGIDSETPPNEAVRLLLQAHRMDGANPKYAYHLARIFYMGADFDRASKWLKRAVQLCPTSHRLWTHVTLLQRDLNNQYYGQYEFEPDDLRNCASQISTYIREGEDRFNDSFLRFEPRPSMASLEAKSRQKGQPNVVTQEYKEIVEPEVLKSAQRLNDRGCCRWSGVFDLSAEEILEAQPSNRSLDQLLPLLTYTARTARFRKGGIAAFAILAVQTLVCGYPLEPVVFLRRTLPPELNLPSLTLLDHVCRLFLSPSEKIPEMLSALLSQKCLPPILAALIHNRLILAAQSLDIRVFGKYKCGRNLLKTIRDAGDIDDDIGLRYKEEAADLSKAIQQANKSFAPKAIKKLKVPSSHCLENIPTEGLVVKYKNLVATVSELGNVQEHLRQAIHDIVIEDCEIPVALAQLTTALELLGALKLHADKASQRLDSLLSATFATDKKDLPKKFHSITEDSRRILNRILYDTLISRQIKAKWENLAHDDVAPTLSPDEKLIQLQATLQNLFSDTLHTQELDLKAEFEAIEYATNALKECRNRAWSILKEKLAIEAKQADTEDRLKQAIADHDALEKFVAELKKASKKGVKQLEDVTKALAQTNDTDLIPDFESRQSACLQKIRELATLGNFSKVLNRVAKIIAKAGTKAGGKPLATITELISQARDAFKQTYTNEPDADTTEGLLSLSASSESLANLIVDIGTLDREYEDNWIRLKTLSEKHKQKTLDDAEKNECGNIADFITTSHAHCLEVLNKVQQLREASTIQDENIANELDGLENRVRKLTGRRGVFLKKLKNLPTDSTNKPPQKNELTFENEQQPPNGRGRPQEPLEGLEYDLDEFKKRIEKHFHSLTASFEPYTGLKTLPALQALYISLLDREAHTLAGLGHRRKARQLWNKVLLQDRLNTNALKNIAICDTFGDDVSRTLASWRAYAEATYFLAIARGNPTYGALERADFHHQFGGAFAPAELSQPLKQKEEKNVDPIALAAFLRSPARVRLFIEHKLIAFLNAKLQFTSPPLILGTGRTDSNTLREQALERLLAFVEKTQQLLPERTQNAFAATVCEHLRQAYDTCKTAKLLTLENDSRYPAEKVQHEQWIKDVCHLKIRVYQTIMNNLESVIDIPSPTFFIELARLDDIPIDQRPVFLQAIGSRMGISDPEMLQGLMHLLQRNVATEVANCAQNDGKPGRYLLLVKALVAGDGLYPNLPQALMHMALATALKNKSSDGHEELAEVVNRWIQRARVNCEAKGKPKEEEISQIISALDDCLLQIFLAPSGGIGEAPVWAEKEKLLAEFVVYYPSSGTGHYWLMISLQQIAVQKYNEGDTKDASEYFEKATRAAQDVLTHSQNEKYCETANELLGKAGTFRQNVGLTAAKDGKFSEALDQLLPELKTKNASPDMVRQVMNIFVQEARQKKNGSKHGKMAESVNNWLKNSSETDSSIDDKEISAIKDRLDEQITKMFLAPLGELNEKTDWSAVENVMLAEQKAYPQNISARYYKMIALFRLANQQAEAGDRTRAKRSLASAADEAKVITDRSHNSSHREDAERILKQIDKILG